MGIKLVLFVLAFVLSGAVINGYIADKAIAAYAAIIVYVALFVLIGLIIYPVKKKSIKPLADRLEET